jgi:hypothetical protein
VFLSFMNSSMCWAPAVGGWRGRDTCVVIASCRAPDLLALV